MNTEHSVSCALAPEDIAVGDYVSLLQVTSEYLPCFMIEDVAYHRIEPVRVAWLPCDAAPMKVINVCLPFVLVRLAGGTHHTLDLRRCRLARVSPGFGKQAFKRLSRRGDSKRARSTGNDG